MKKAVLFLIILAGFLIQPTASSAVTIPGDFEYIDAQKDIIIHVVWETEQPDLLFIAPDGTEYDPALEQEGTMTVIGESQLFYVIYNAPKGQWKIKYDKKSNETIQIGVDDYDQNFFISSFMIGEMNGDELSVSFMAEHTSKDVEYQYTISACLEKLGEEKELLKGRAYANRQNNVVVNLGQLASYPEYILKLHVIYHDNGTDIFDMTYSEPFSYMNPATPQTDSDFSLRLNSDEYLVDIGWGQLPGRTQSVLVALFENGAAEPFFFDEYAPDEESVSLSYNPGIQSLKVEFSVRTDDLYSVPAAKVIDFAASPDVILEDVTATNKRTLEMQYRNFGGQKALLTVNDNQTELYLEGGGDLGIPLADDWNTVSIEYTDGNNITWIVERKVFVDLTPPVLSLLEDYSGVFTEEPEYVILGTAGDCHTLTIGGQEVPFDAAGSFSHTVSLKDGENRFDIVASDALGNETLYTAIITKGAGTEHTAAVLGPDGSGSGETAGESILNGYLPLVIGGVLGLLALLDALIFWRRRKKHSTGDIGSSNP